jgi:hypothetical protein
LDIRRPNGLGRQTPARTIALAAHGEGWEGSATVKRPEIPEYHWGVIVRCWQKDPKARLTFQTLLKEFHEDHEYILPGSDRSVVLEYEDQVGSDIGGPNARRLKEFY